MLFKEFLDESYDIDEQRAYLIAESIATFVISLLENGRYDEADEHFEVDKDSLNKAVFWMRQKAILDRKREYPEEPGNDLDASDEDILRNAPKAKEALWRQMVPLVQKYMRRLHRADPDLQDELTNSLIPRIFNWLTVRKKNKNQPWSALPPDMAEYLFKVAKNELFKVSREQRRQLAPTSFIKQSDEDKAKNPYGRVVIGGDVAGGWSGGKGRAGRTPGGDSDVHQQMLATSLGYDDDASGDSPDDVTNDGGLPGSKNSEEVPGASMLMRQERWKLLHDALHALARRDDTTLNSHKTKRWLQTYGATESEMLAWAIKIAFGIDPDAEPGESVGNRTIGQNEKHLKEFGTANYSVLISKKLGDYVRANVKEDAPDVNPNTIRAWFNDETIGLWLQNYLLPIHKRKGIKIGDKVIRSERIPIHGQGGLRMPRGYLDYRAAEVDSETDSKEADFIKLSQGLK